MHVAQRDREHGGGDAGAAEVDRVGVRVGAAARHLGRGRDPLGLRGLVEQAVHARAHDRAAGEHGTVAEPVLAELARLDARGRPSRGSRRPRSPRRAPARTPSRGRRAPRSPPARPRPPPRGPRRRRRRPRAGPPRAPRTRPAGCRARATPPDRRAAPPARPRSRPGSPGRTSSSASSRSAAPMSTWSPFSSTAFLRSSASSRWIGLRPHTPGTGPSAPRTCTRWPTRICGVPAAGRDHLEVALLRHVAHEHGDLVDVARPPRAGGARRGRRRAPRACPCRPRSRLANCSAAACQAATARPSWPGAPGVVRSSRRKSGITLAPRSWARSSSRS